MHSQEMKKFEERGNEKKRNKGNKKFNLQNCTFFTYSNCVCVYEGKLYSNYYMRKNEVEPSGN